MRLAVLTSSLALVAAACGQSTAESDPFDGVWRSIGFGAYIVVDSGAIEVFEHGAGHCVSVAESGSRGISDVLTFEGEDRIVLQEAGRVVRYDRVPSLPEACDEPDFFDGDPIETLAIVVEAIEDHYASALDPGWPARRDELAAGLTADASTADAFAAVTALLDPLDDPQVRIAVDGGGDGVPDGVWRSFADPAAGRLLDATTAGEHLSSIEGVRGEGALVAGLVGDDIGYLALTTLEPFAGGIANTGEEIAAVVDGLIETSGPDTKLIVDLRVNDGGVEGLGMLVASRFVREETLVASRSARLEGSDQYVEAGSIVVRPAPTGTFAGSVVVLVGPGTSGAAELLVLALRSIPGVLLVGEATAGSPSPILARALPTEWALGVPNQRTVDSSGASYDGTGIPPDEVVGTTSADLDAGRDPGLERAIALLGA